MQRVCVFCGSGMGVQRGYAAVAEQFGRELVAAGLGLVYGGAQVGLMGVVADAVLDAGGEAIGVIPEILWDLEVGHRGLTDLRIVGSMHERKALMAELADGFVALPGGIGTLEEFCEILTWAHLGAHQKPCGLLNVGRFYDPLLALLDHMTDQGFLRRASRDLVLVETEPAVMLARFLAYQPPQLPKLVDRTRT